MATGEGWKEAWLSGTEAPKPSTRQELCCEKLSRGNGRLSGNHKMSSEASLWTRAEVIHKRGPGGVQRQSNFLWFLLWWAEQVDVFQMFGEMYFWNRCCRKTNYHIKGRQCQESEGEWHALTVFNPSLFLFLYSEKQKLVLVTKAPLYQTCSFTCCLPVNFHHMESSGLCTSTPSIASRHLHRWRWHNNSWIWNMYVFYFLFR